jgi:hypothetical protein
VIHDESSPHGDLDALLDLPTRFWQCPVEGHRYRTDRDGFPLATVEWDGDVAGCLFRGCGRISTDPVPRGECWCDGDTPDGEECAGECCGIGECTCTPDRADGGSSSSGGGL